MLVILTVVTHVSDDWEYSHETDTNVKKVHEIFF